MKFIEGTPDIPDELVDETLAGDVVFLCGAGISRRTGLPLFKELTELIYTELGETFDDDPPEKESFEKKEYDRTLRALEKRLRRPGSATSPVRIACVAKLQIPAGENYPDHEAVVVLSRDREGRSRVLTTNFDTLFERAAAWRGEDWSSEAVKALPKPGGPRDFGIHHLHGRLADPKLGLAESDLILTSADFGDAYLRDGWASRYIEDRMRTATLVLVGYGAEDAALRLLLETLDVDRERFPDLNKVYALDRSSGGSASHWRAKGVIPLEFDSHDALYATLSAWARYVEHPSEFERTRVGEILAGAPGEATEFDRAQLRSLTRRGNAAALLMEANPSLAWLPALGELQLVRFDDRWLAAWIGENLHDPSAVSEVVARLGMFGPGVADTLTYSLNRSGDALAPFLRQSWTLLIRHMRNNQRGLTPASGWYDLLPAFERGDRSADTITRLTQLLKPALKIEKRFRLDDDEPEVATTVHDLMRVDYEPEENIAIDEVLSAWSVDTSPEANFQLVTALSHALDNTLDDAVDIGVESNRGSGLTDFDVASVAEHAQNRYRRGFLPIVRTIAEIWTRLAVKDPARALEFVTAWISSQHKLNHRLALFAAGNPAVPPDMVKKVLTALPRAELFLTAGTVELHRLLMNRWNDLTAEFRGAFEARIRSGPPADWFREGADVDRHIDRSRFDVIGNLLRAGIDLSAETRDLQETILQRWPEWKLRPEAQSGFHSWHEFSAERLLPDPEKLKDIPDQELVEVALRADAAADFGDGQNWRSLCEREPESAFRALLADAEHGRWRANAWRQLLLSAAIAADPVAAEQVTARLLQWPDASFSEIASYAAEWLGKPEILAQEALRWPLWDRLCASLPEEDADDIPDSDLFQKALNVPIGKLAEVLLQLMPSSEKDPLFAKETAPRLDALVEMPGRGGALARTRLAAELNFMFDRAPEWTTARLIPLFAWDAQDAQAVWAARQYSRFIGGARLFALTKGPFLQLFRRVEVPDEVIRTFAGWLVSILLANQTGDAKYDLSFVEARVALRRTSPSALQSVAHDLAEEMEKAKPDQKLVRWRYVVGPVFRGLWPQDVDLLSGTVTFKFLQILRATGEAFPEAADAILPFIVPEEREQGTAAYSLAKADEILFTSAPATMLDVVTAAVGKKPAGSVFDLQKILDRIAAAEPKLADGRKFQSLVQMARPRGS
ncbi:SIR2 family protein (plasmid) [Rhizobium leguminosarum bv. viciae 248]|uniref:SIR2 family protein n=1 Tax=Rhizobium leguminosarum TaxID=384 RepID=UPI0003A6E971|nr:SIR2 family protein [Rhizobium leguminosarum]QHW28424.1 SIR2 family protein [Rhizobium leguminosarum bv. viciae 248]